MFNFLKFFKSKPEVEKGIYNKKGKFVSWDDTAVQVRYEGQAVSNDYTMWTLVYNEKGQLRKNFNEQKKNSLHTLHPHGFGKITYFDEWEDDTIYEEYEGEFLYGQYHGKGKLIFRTGEILEGRFENNKFLGKIECFS